MKAAQLQRLMPFTELVERVERLAGGASLPARASVPAPAVSPAPASASVPRTVPVAAAVPAPAAAPPPAPAPAASAPPATTPEAIVAAMTVQAQSRPSLAQPLRTATAREEGGTLVIEVSSDFAAMAAMNQEEYRQLAPKAAGRAVKVRIQSAAAPADAARETDRRQRLLDDAAREPAVQEALDLFNGKVVDVRKA
jgi:2-oxoglutarate dehydrogenase E2 component (dihydrolipoamide succinyltransferase)